MNLMSYQSHVSSVTRKMIAFLLSTVNRPGQGDQVTLGLPAGAVHVDEARMIFAGTPCERPLCSNQMRAAASKTGADIVMAHHGFYPEALNPLTFTVLVHVGGEPMMLTELVLYRHSDGGFWLVPAGHGPFVAIEVDGLRLDHEAPFITFHQRCDGVCAAAASVLRFMKGTR